MAVVQWSDSLSVNVMQIDGQHQRLVILINDLYDAQQAHKGKDAVGMILAELTTYTVSHFSTEEKYFDQYGYPETLSHKQEHKNFIGEVAQFRKDFDDGRACVSFKVMNVLGDWLKNHILGSDKKYSSFFNTKGLK